MAEDGSTLSRRKFLKLAATALAVGPALLTGTESAFAAGTTRTADINGRKGALAVDAPLRIISVPTTIDGGLLPVLVKSFHLETGLSVEVTSSNDPFTPARMGKHDLVISHFGHRDLEKFILKGFGRWPRTVFSNQLALFGPPADPAKIRGLTNLVQAFEHIAKAKPPYVVNDTHGIRYLSEIIWRAAGKPAKGSWYVEQGVSKGDAIAFAAKRGGYVLWGITPFQQHQKAAPLPLEPLVTADALLQRIMVAVVVNPEQVSGVNAAGAARFQEYLLTPATQAKILDTHYPGIKQAEWSPAGRHNAGSALPKQDT
ncbi:MAG: substrate-binding domain-containing protein [Geobacteraceae bacterium]